MHASTPLERRPPGAAPNPVCADRSNPSLYDALAADPTLTIDPRVRAALVADARSWSRRYVSPSVRTLCRVGIALVLLIKRVLPFEVSSEARLGRIAAWFLASCVSEPAQYFVLRHFSVETNLVNFVTRNCGDASLREVDLRTTCAAELVSWDGQNTIVRHDANVFNLFIDLGRSETADVRRRRSRHALDLGRLDVPEPLVTPPQLLALDLYSTVSLTALLIAIFLDRATTERAINSFQLDESLLDCIANLTGDVTFRTWAPQKLRLWLGSPTGDPARDLHWHMLVTEYAHGRLCQIRDARDAGAEP